MKAEKKANKKQKKAALVEKIHQDRLIFDQELGWVFRPMALAPFPADSLGKRTIIKKDGTQDDEFEILWTRRTKNIEVEILAHPKYGVPFGQDTLIILYLAIEARKQNSRKIKVNFYRDFMRMFDMNPNSGFKYNLVIDGLKRIKNSKYSWRVLGEEDRDKELHYLYIEELDLYCFPKNPDQKPLFDQYILLSERFWNEVDKHKIPFNLDAIRYLKTKPAYLNFHIWLSTRLGQLYFDMKEKKLGKGELFIPYWGDFGLQNQLSSKIKRRPDYRVQVRNWLKTTKKIWPLCPVSIEGDGLKIELMGPEQLDVQINPQIEIGKAIRKSQEEAARKGKPCPICESETELRKGFQKADKSSLPDYFRCPQCKKNFYQKDYPQLYKEVDK